METDNKQDNIDEELNYWRVDYESKMTENKIYSIKYHIEILGNFLKSKDFIIQNNNLVCLASSVECEIKIYPQFDYKKEPNKPKRIQITKKDFVNKKDTEILIGIFNNTPLDEPDFNRLLENPYKDMSIADIELLEKRKSEMPEPMNQMIHSMITRNWLVSYQTYEGIDWALIGISKRLSVESAIENATQELRKDYLLYENEFQQFFPDVVADCRIFLDSLA